jgi:hypothetical protein
MALSSLREYSKGRSKVLNARSKLYELLISTLVTAGACSWAMRSNDNIEMDRTISRSVSSSALARLSTSTMV